MIKSLYINGHPFAICCGTIEFCNEEAIDWYLLTPAEKHKSGLKFKGYRKVTTETLSERDKAWFKSNRKLFRTAHSDLDGKIYEPIMNPRMGTELMPFKERIRCMQLKFY